MRWPLLLLLSLASAQEAVYSEECKNAMAACEADLECGNRLAPLMAACTTSTCQPQCRMAVLNVYQNRLGRSLLRSDVSCLPGREELKTCNFLPTGAVVHCGVAKLSCEADLECNAGWEAFVSECEVESKKGSCPARCSTLLSMVTATASGAPFASCTCTDKEDQLCEHLRDNVIGSCTKPQPSGQQPMEGNSVIDASPSLDPVSSSPLPSFLSAFCLLLLPLL